MPYVAAQAHLNMQAKNKSIKEMIVLLFLKKKLLHTEGQSNKTLVHCGNQAPKLFGAANRQSGKNTGLLIKSQIPQVSALGPSSPLVPSAGKMVLISLTSPDRAGLGASFTGTQPHCLFTYCLRCYHGTEADLSYCDRDRGAARPKTFTSWPFKQKLGEHAEALAPAPHASLLHCGPSAVRCAACQTPVPTVGPHGCNPSRGCRPSFNKGDTALEQLLPQTLWIPPASSEVPSVLPLSLQLSLLSLPP